MLKRGEEASCDPRREAFQAGDLQVQMTEVESSVACSRQAEEASVDEVE